MAHFPTGRETLVTFNKAIIPQSREVKYLGLLLDKRLTWVTHLKNKRKQLNSRLCILRPLLKSKLNTSNRLFLYKSLLQPIWFYGIALWSTAKPANIKTIQAFIPSHLPTNDWQCLLVRYQYQFSHRAKNRYY